VVPSTSWPGPRRSVEELCVRHGRDAVVRACLDLLAGRKVDGSIVHALGGPPARWAVTGGPPGPDYWLRVWALRGLQWLWDDRATPAVVGALSDEAWRVREMAAKVAARHDVDAALDALLHLRDDPVARVRAAATRAVEKLTSG
jgi:HEAT repeat protein